MSRSIIVVITIVGAFVAVGCEEDGYPTTFYVAGGGKGEGAACPVSDRCAGDNAPIISMDAWKCGEEGLQQRQEQREQTQPPPPAEGGPWMVAGALDTDTCRPAATCFPSSHEGLMDVVKDYDTYGDLCSNVKTPFYWFEGGQIPWLLQVNIETKGGLTSNWFGRGEVKLEVRRFVNGRNTDPLNESPKYHTESFEEPVWPGDTIVILPVPANEKYLDEESKYVITFDKKELCTNTSTKADCNPPDYRPPESQPDYYVKEFTAKNSTSNTIAFDVTICNRGGSSDKKFDVELHYNRDEAPGCPAEGTTNTDADFDDWKVSGMFWEGEAFCKTMRTHHKRFLEPVSAMAWVVVDGDCQVAELADLPADNVASHPYATGDLKPPAAGARLVLRDHKVIVTDNTLHYRAEICNEGTQPSSGSTQVKVWQLLGVKPTAGMNNETHAWSNIPVLTPVDTEGACHTLPAFDQKNVPKGTYTAQWMIVTSDEVDPAADYSSRYEVVKTSTATTGGTTTPEKPAEKPDLVVKDATAEQSKKGSDLVTFTATICNEGAPTTKKALVGLFYDAAEPRCGTKLKYDQSFVLPGGLGAEEKCKTFSVKVVLKEGSYSASFMADVECVIDELNEKNNNGKPIDYAVGPGQEPPKTRKEEANPDTNGQSRTGQQPHQTPKPTAPPVEQKPPYLTQPPATDDGCSLGHQPGGDLVGLLLITLLALRRRSAASRRRATPPGYRR